MQLSYSNEVTLGKHLRMGGWLHGEPEFWRGERSWRLSQSPMANDSVNHAYVMKFPEKRKQKGFGELPGW